VFLSSLGSLLGSKNPNIRKRALEVVTAKLGDEGENSLPPAALANLLPLLVGLATTDDQPANQMVSRTNFVDFLCGTTIIHCAIIILYWNRGLRRDVVDLGYLVYEPKCGGRVGVAGSQPMSTAYSRAQVNLEDLTPYLTYVFNYQFSRELKENIKFAELDEKYI
jgi:hypothetical protein